MRAFVEPLIPAGFSTVLYGTYSHTINYTAIKFQIQYAISKTTILTA